MPTSHIPKQKRPKFRTQSMILTECSFPPSGSCKATCGAIQDYLYIRDNLYTTLKVYNDVLNPEQVTERMTTGDSVTILVKGTMMCCFKRGNFKAIMP